MRGAVRPRVLAIAAAAIAGLVGLGTVATVAVWGFRNGTDESVTTVGGWLLLLWLAVGFAITMVAVVAVTGVRSLRRPLEDLSRAANELQVERLPTALREIEAGAEPAPPRAITAPAELEGVAGALENLERFVHYHAKRAQRADRDLGTLLSGAADRVAARARIAEDIDLGPPTAVASGLHRDEDALRALVPETVAPRDEDRRSAGPGLSIGSTVSAAAQTTLRPPAVRTGDLERVTVDANVGGAVMVVLGEVIDAAIGDDGTAVVNGSVQPEGYHVIIEAAIGTRVVELADLADALRDHDPDRLPFGLRAAVQAGKRARLLVWLTIGDATAQWHVLVPPDSFAPYAVVATPILPYAKPAEVQLPAAVIDLTEPATTPANGSAPHLDPARVATARRLGEELADLFGRLEVALDARAPHGPGIDESERTALLIDGTSLVGRLQETELCSPHAQRALLKAIDMAVETEPSVPLAGRARDRVTLPYEALAEIREHIAEALGGFRTPSPR